MQLFFTCLYDGILCVDSQPSCAKIRVDVRSDTNAFYGRSGMLPRVCGFGKLFPDFSVDEMAISLWFLLVAVDFKREACYYFNDADFPHKYKDFKE